MSDWLLEHSVSRGGGNRTGLGLDWDWAGAGLDWDGAVREGGRGWTGEGRMGGGAPVEAVAVVAVLVNGLVVSTPSKHLGKQKKQVGSCEGAAGEGGLGRVLLTHCASRKKTRAMYVAAKSRREVRKATEARGVWSGRHSSTAVKNGCCVQSTEQAERTCT